MPTTDSPLRYPGGKSQLAPLVVEILRENNLLYGDYVEVFAGGAGIAWTLLLNSYVSHVHINDLDPAIHAFWSCVLNKTDDLCARIDSIDITIAEWQEQKVFQDAKRVSILDLGFSTFFLNRTNRSGIIRGGVIGGIEQSGNYQLDCRFNRKDLIRKIRRIALHRDQITLYKLDAIDFIKNVIPDLPSKTLVNLDPPYYVKGPGLYKNHFTPQDHIDLARAVRKIKPYWMVTYDDVSETRALYNKFPSFNQELNYSAQEKRVGTELMVLDPRLDIPSQLKKQQRRETRQGQHR